VVRRLLAKASFENFFVWLPGLEPALVSDLKKTYAFCRLVDDIGDEDRRDRTALLHEVGEAMSGSSRARLLFPEEVAIVEDFSRMCGERGVPLELPFNLVRANLLDQAKRRYRRLDELYEYCRLSAEPVGRIVLALLAAHGYWMLAPADVCAAWSDAVCRALQVIEHVQDAAEDARRGRVYVPEELLKQEGASPEDVLSCPRSPGVRAALSALAEAARGDLAAGLQLVGAAQGAARWLLASYVGGGFANLAALERAGFDPLDPRRKARRWAIAVACLRVARAARHAGALPACADELLTREAESQVDELRRRGSSFLLGMRVLDTCRFRAMCAVYQEARYLDDLADSDIPVGRKLELLAKERKALSCLAASAEDRHRVLAAASLAYGPFEGELSELHSACERDARGDVPRSQEGLLEYAKGVAGSVGRASVKIFTRGHPREEMMRMADRLGVALQLINIARDVAEDAAAGRDYLRCFGGREKVAAEIRSRSGPFVDLVDDGMEAGSELSRMLDWRAAACVLLMRAAYSRYWAKIARDPWAAFSNRVCLGLADKVAIVFSALIDTARSRVGAR
jgi:phytoene synthase